MSFLHRSVLYLPGANTRAQEKATNLDCDGLIFDLEDAVAPAAKINARANVAASVRQQDYGHRELIVRVNALDTPWGAADVLQATELPIHAVLFPKVESAEMVREAVTALQEGAAQAGRDVPALWLMIESPRSILSLEEICQASAGVRALVMGTSDLVQALRAQHTENREPLQYALSRAVTVARAFGLDILDGVHLDFRNLESFERTCEQGRAMGFDGRSLIHPGQVEIANRVYGFSDDEVAHAQRLLEVWEQAEAQGLGVVELDGQLVENLHAAEARRVLAMAQALKRR